MEISKFDVIKERIDKFEHKMNSEFRYYFTGMVHCAGMFSLISYDEEKELVELAEKYYEVNKK